MAKQEPRKHDRGAASATKGPHEITPERLRKSNGQVSPADVPPPDAELHPPPGAPEPPR